jgi:drug/metabolite transporter (DMT)-like permease
MATSVEPHATRTGQLGLALALVSGASFGLSGVFAKALLAAGWSPLAAVFARLAGAAIVLAVPAGWLLRGRWRPNRTSATVLVLYGATAVAGCQVCFFNAVRYLPVGVALLIEYLAPVLIVGWTWWRTRIRPSGSVAAGVLLALLGLVFVLNLTGPVAVSLVGVAWALVAALCLGFYFVLASRQDDDLPPLMMAAGGTTVGAIGVAAVGVTGLLPITFTARDTAIGTIHASWWVALVLLILIATVLAYVTGIEAVRRLGPKLASFTALTEVLFAVLAAWLLLGEAPRLPQLIGGACIIAGIVVIRRDELSRPS